MTRRGSRLAATVALLASLVGACKPDRPKRTYMCLVAGTEIETPGGAIAIERLAVGDLVWSWDLARDVPVIAPVTAISAGSADQVLTVRAGAAMVAGVTAEHPFFEARRRRWLPAEQLTSGDQLLSWSGDAAAPAAMTAVESVAASARSGPVDVFNLEVADHHVYFAAGVLVHNKQPTWSDHDGDGYYDDGPDCDDGDTSIHQDAAEVCGDGIDQSCDGVIDDGCVTAARPPLRVDAVELDTYGAIVLAPPYGLALGEGDHATWVEAIDLAGAPRVVTVAAFGRPTTWSTLPDDAAMPAALLLIEDAFRSYRLVLIAVDDAGARVVLDLPVTVSSCLEAWELSLAVDADGAATLAVRDLPASCPERALDRQLRWEGDRFISR